MKGGACGGVLLGLVAGGAGPRLAWGQVELAAPVKQYCGRLLDGEWSVRP